MGEMLSGSGRFPESGLSEQDVTAAPPPAGPTLGSSAGLVGERAVSVSSGRHHNAPRTRWPNQQKFSVFRVRGSRCWQGWFPPRPLCWAHRWPPSMFPHHLPSVPVCVQISSFCRDTIHTGLGTTPEVWGQDSNLETLGDTGQPVTGGTLVVTHRHFWLQGAAVCPPGGRSPTLEACAPPASSF